MTQELAVRIAVIFWFIVLPIAGPIYTAYKLGCT